jgi:hypothetical protein
MVHPSLDELLTPVAHLSDTIRTKAFQRLEHEKLHTSKELTDSSSRWYKRPHEFAMHRFAYYLCFKVQSIVYPQYYPYVLPLLQGTVYSVSTVLPLRTTSASRYSL